MFHGAYGERLGQSVRVSNPRMLTTTTHAGALLAVTEIRIDQADFGTTSPLANEEAYLLCLHLRPQKQWQLWLDDFPVGATSCEAGSTCIVDLRRHPIAYISDPLHVLCFYLPKASLMDINDEQGSAASGYLGTTFGECRRDTVIYGIAQALLPLFERRLANTQPLVDHLLLALRAHVVMAYGGKGNNPFIMRGALAPWQQRTVRQMIQDRVVEGVPISDLAEACGMSSGALVRGFKKSTGVSPHQWLLLRRIDHATELMADADLSLAEIAAASGFADQSHFNRIFAQKMGVSPGAWRRSLDIRAMRKECA